VRFQCATKGSTLLPAIDQALDDGRIVRAATENGLGIGQVCGAPERPTEHGPPPPRVFVPQAARPCASNSFTVSRVTTIRRPVQDRSSDARPAGPTSHAVRKQQLDDRGLAVLACRDISEVPLRLGCATPQQPIGGEEGLHDVQSADFRAAAPSRFNRAPCSARKNSAASGRPLRKRRQPADSIRHERRSRPLRALDQQRAAARRSLQPSPDAHWSPQAPTWSTRNPLAVDKRRQTRGSRVEQQFSDGR